MMRPDVGGGEGKEGQTPHQAAVAEAVASARHRLYGASTSIYPVFCGRLSKVRYVMFTCIHSRTTTWAVLLHARAAASLRIHPWRRRRSTDRVHAAATAM